MVVLPAGTYQMGSEVGGAAEQPIHAVTFARPFAIARYQTTFDEWDACYAAGGTDYRPEERPRYEEYRFPRSTRSPEAEWTRGRRPVINVSWYDAKRYIAWLTTRSGKPYRLPTEAEWEYACRAGTRTEYATGTSIDATQCNGNFFDSLQGRSTMPVGSCPPNAFGLYDMHGNVWEWVADARNADTYVGAPPDGSAWDVEGSAGRLLRGGSWKDPPNGLRSAVRKHSSAFFRYNGGSLGFRVARSLTPVELGLTLRDLGGPIKTRDLDELRPQLERLQGNILKTHGRDHAAHLMLRFVSAGARPWIHAFSRLVTTAWEQMQQARAYREGRTTSPHRGIALSSSGLRALGLSIDGHDFFFKAGMKAFIERFADPPIADWEPAYQKDVHAMIVVADDDKRVVDREIAAIVASLSGIAEVTTIEHGQVTRNADGYHIEHFGFVDGRSDPLFFERDVEAEGDGTSVWKPGAKPDLVLVDDPHTPSLHGFGSYLVFRKLEQNVRGFRIRERQLVEALGSGPGDAPRIAALIMGRFRDGTPLVMQAKEGMTCPVPNNFDFRGDPAGTRCPFHAHIRKMNPRGEHMPLREEDLIRIIRRGINYGDWTPSGPVETLPVETLPNGGVGLLFMCFQADIQQQFDFLQRQYANDGEFLYGPNPGLDPVVGQTPPGDCPPLMEWGGDGPSPPMPVTQRWPPAWNAPPEQHIEFTFRGFVTMKGGEFFFAPSIDTLQALCDPAPEGPLPAPEGTLEQFGARLRALLAGLMGDDTGGAL
jgi:Dyp-type peroxidase family